MARAGTPWLSAADMQSQNAMALSNAQWTSHAGMQPHSSMPAPGAPYASSAPRCTLGTTAYQSAQGAGVPSGGHWVGTPALQSQGTLVPPMAQTQKNGLGVATGGVSSASSAVPGPSGKWTPISFQEDEAAIMLTEFVCEDESFMSVLGNHNRSLSWTLDGGGRSTPARIGFSVEKGMMGKAEVLITENDRSLYPRSGGSTKASLSEDFVQRWNFCGRAAGLHERHFYEVQVHPEEEAEKESGDASPAPQPAWYPATLERQLEDGCSFEVLVADRKSVV